MKPSLMKVLIKNNETLYGENIKLIKNVSKRENPKEFPEIIKWSLQLVYKNFDNWIEVCRIDNYLHNNQQGAHIHIYKKKQVKRIDINYSNAKKKLIRIGRRVMLDNFGVDFNENNNS